MNTHNMTDFCPNVFLVGAQRTGTTFLADILGQYPDICVSNPKEPVFFTRNLYKGHQWYADRFEDRSKKILLDASTWYSLAPTDAFPAPLNSGDEGLSGIPARIHSLAPEAKIIYSIREPAVRMYSLFWFLQRENWDSHDLRNFRKTIDMDPFFFRSSDYYGQIQNFLEFFRRDQILVLVFERTVANLPRAVQQCLDFMSLSSQCFEPQITGKNRNGSFIYSPFGNMLARTLGSTERVEQIRRTGSRGGTLVARTIDSLLVRDLPPLSMEDRDYVREKMGGSCALLSEWLEDPLPEWQFEQSV